MRRTSILAALLVLSIVSVGVAAAQTARDHRATGVARRVTSAQQVTPQENPPGVVYAGTSIRCGNTIYHISVNGGSCGNQTAQAGGGKGCSNSAGDQASANCQSGCGDTKGSGDCRITAAPN